MEAKLYLPGIVLQQLDQLGDVVDPERRRNRQRAWLRDQLRDRRDVLLRVVGQLGEQQRVDGERPADADADDRAVGLGLGDRVGAEIAAGARLVLHHESAARIFLAELIGDQPRHRVGRRAGAERHIDVHGLGRPALRLRGERGAEQ